MPNGIGGLSDPIVVLGGLWYIGENKRSFTGGMSGMDILAGGFGAASAQWGGDQVQRLIGQDRLTDQLSQTVAGAALSKWGGMVPQNRAMSRGILLNVAQQGFSGAGVTAGDLLGGLDGLGGGGGGGNGGSNQNSQNGQQADQGPAFQGAGGKTFG